MSTTDTHADAPQSFEDQLASMDDATHRHLAAGLWEHAPASALVTRTPQEQARARALSALMRAIPNPGRTEGR